MSDFLTRLAERTLGLASVVEPVLPSMFAPAVDIERFEAGFDDLEESAETRPATAAAEAGRVTVRATEEAAQTAAAARSTESAPVTSPASMRGSLVPRVAEVPPASGPLVDDAAGIPARDRLTAAAPEGRATPAMANPEPLVRAVPPSETVAAPHLDAAVREAVGSTSAVPPAPSESRTASFAPLVAQHRTSSVAREAVEAPRAARTEPSGPTVRIHIGRVDVRAVTPPPAATPRPRRDATEEEQRLSLSDYLKRGGGR